VQGYLDQKEEVERESNEKVERRRRAKERKKQGLPPEEPPKEDNQAEKTFDWHFVHMSVFFDDDSRQLILTHDGTPALVLVRFLRLPMPANFDANR
jgi:hypothetical protein